MEDELQKIETLLEARDLDGLIGRAESRVFEAKGSDPYDFSQAFGRWELAKDVSSFANSDGGFIIIGLINEKLPGQDIDRVGALSLIQESAFESSQYKGIVRDYINGEISRLRVRWVEHKDKPGLGVGVIQVPPQHNDSKPFLLYELDESGKTRRIVFGIVSRKGAHSVPNTAGELRKGLSQGMSNTATRLTRIEEQLANMHDQLLTIDANQQKIGEAQQQPPPATPSPDPLDSRIEQALEDE